MGNANEKKDSFLKRNYGATTVLTSIPALILDIFFIGFNFFLCVYMLSFWHLTMALYYILLVILRINVFARSTKALFSKDKERAYIKLYRSTHRMLLFLDFMLIIAIFLLLENDVWKSYPRIVINLVAIYTCYKIIASVVNLFKASSSKSITATLLRKIGHADALVSVLILISAYIGMSGHTGYYKNLELAYISGGVATLIIFIISVAGLLKPKAKIIQGINKPNQEE